MKDQVERLVFAALHADGKERDELMDELCQVVKRHYEGDDAELLKPVENAMPQLAEYLLDSDNGNVDGCTISIFRRIAISSEAVTRLLQLQEEHPNRTVVEAIGNIDRLHWTDQVEFTLANALKNKETAPPAAYALYCKTYCIEQKSTIAALATAVWSSNWQASHHSVAALACLTSKTHGEYAIEVLGNVIEKADPELRVKIADCLGWATDQGLSLLSRLACDESPEVRIATAKSLGRGYSQKQDAKDLLEMLKRDSDSDLRNAATEALKPML